MGGSSGGGAVDKEYNKRIAAIAEGQQAMAEEMQGYYREWGLPLDVMTTQAQMDVMPYESAAHIAGLKGQMEIAPYEGALKKAQLQAETGLVPEQTGLISAQIGSQMQLLPHQTNLAQKQIGQQLKLMPHQTKHDIAQYGYGAARAGALQELLPEQLATQQQFLQSARQGVDANRWASQAAADVAQGFSQARGSMQREAGRMGLQPGSERMMHGLSNLGKQEALSTASAQTHARREADDMSFSRLQAGAGLGM